MVSRPFLRNVNNPRFESMRQRLLWSMLQRKYSHTSTVMDVLRHGLKVRFISALYRCQMDSSPVVVNKNNGPKEHWQQPPLCDRTRPLAPLRSEQAKRSSAERRREREGRDSGTGEEKERGYGSEDTARPTWTDHSHENDSKGFLMHTITSCLLRLHKMLFGIQINHTLPFV